MELLRRLKLTISALLTVLLVGGASLPSPALWQCRYSSRIVSAAFTPTPNAMPCLTDSAMAFMPCCHLKTLASPMGHARSGQTVSSAPCHPTLTALAAVSSAISPTEAHLYLRQSLTSQQAAALSLPVFAVAAPVLLANRQRPPPPTLGSSASSPKHFPGLRAPPAA